MKITVRSKHSSDIFLPPPISAKLSAGGSLIVSVSIAEIDEKELQSPNTSLAALVRKGLITISQTADTSRSDVLEVASVQAVSDVKDPGMQTLTSCGSPPLSPVLWIDANDPLNGTLPTNGDTLGDAGQLVVNKGTLGGTFSAAATAEPIWRQSCFGPTASKKRPCIRFDGSNDVLTSSLAASSWTFLHSTDYTCAVMYRIPLYSPEVTYPLFATAGTATSQVGHITAWDDSGSAEFRLRVEQKNGGSVTNNRILANVLPQQLWTRQIVTYDDNLTTDAIVGYSNNTQIAASGAQLATPVGTAPSNTLRIGSFGNVTGGFLDGDISQIVCYNSVLNVTDRTALDSWMQCVQTAAPYGPRPGLSEPAVAEFCATGDDPCYVGVMGDSITGVVSPVSWANGALRNGLPRSHIIRNEAVGGTTIEIAKTNQWANILSPAGIHVLLMLIGTNDIGLNNTPSVDILADIDEVTTSALAQGVKVVYVSILPRCVSYGGACAARQVIQDEVNAGLAARANNTTKFFIDAYATMEEPTDTNNLRTIYDSGDGLHPNQTGHDALGAFVLTYF